MTDRSRERGLTLVEMLIAAAILMTILGALGGLLIGTNRAYEVNRSVTTGAGQLRNAVQAIQYDVGLAGFCGVASACDLGTPLAVVTADKGGDRTVTTLTTRYTENRYGAQDAVVTIVYSIEDGSLMRSENGAAAVAIAEDIQALKLIGYRSRADLDPVVRFNRPAAAELVGVDLRLEYLQGQTLTSQQFTVLLQNPQ
ncbi:MAG TPA: prepilin-type N-terminal cleavage/methylation domain-containing protein [Trueperaceae bacterium]|nr:prepilin-type N-terminal cleavage/methylation domain-containing protein [Trueperaceae bacterium]